MSGIGHIGELQTIKEMEKKGYEIYLPMKDKGIDFIAIKDNQTTQIQVKTSTFHAESYYWFDLHKNRMIYNENTYYVFVLYVLPRRRMLGKAKNYLVIPSQDLEEMIKNGSIVPRGNNNDIFSLKIYPDEKNEKWVYKNIGEGKELDLTKYWNVFDKI